MNQETELDKLYRIGREIDVDAPGHFARVYQARPLNDRDRSLAFKIMRHEHMYSDDRAVEASEWKPIEWNAFKIEVRALKQFGDHPMVIDFVDCGFIDTPADDDPDYPRASDTIVSLSTDVATFVDQIDGYREQGWRPYIVTEYISSENATYYVTSRDVNRKRFPTYMVLELMSQFVDLLIYVQDQGFIYGDHKLSHTYWVIQEGRLKVIDWNGGRFIHEDSEFTPDQLKHQDVRDLILKVMFGLLTGEHHDEYGMRPEGGRTQNVERVILPPDQPGHDVLQPFFDLVSENKIRNALELREALDDLMLLYGIPVKDKSVQQEAREGRQKFLDLLCHLDDALQAVDSVKTDAYQQIAPRYPRHIREEFKLIIRAANTVSNSNDLLTSVHFLKDTDN